MIGTTHRLRRKILQPFLNLKNLSEYTTFFDTYSNLSADTLEKNVNGPIFNLKPYIARYVFNIFLGENHSAHVFDKKRFIYNRTFNKLLSYKSVAIYVKYN